jgi:hypothetical protein
MLQASPIRPRRRWPIVVVALLILGGGLWSGVWFYGAGIAARTIAGWKAREAKAGRIYTCTSQTIGGFPFGFEVHCDDPGAELTSNRPPLSLKAGGMRVSAHLWQPTVLTTDFAGPLMVSGPGQAATVTARWRSAQAELRGLPDSPESVALRIDKPVVDRIGDSQNLFKADRVTIRSRMVSGTVQNNPVIETVVTLAAASASYWHPAAAIPVDANVTSVLRGLKDFAPKPWPQRLRELQEAGGHMEIKSARVQQGDTIAVAHGALGLSPSGRLDGQLQLTVANLDQLLPKLGLDRMLSPQAASPKLNKAFGALDRIMPGLGNLARQNAGPAIAAGVTLMGQPTQLEGQRAVTLPLRFDDGMVSLGPLKIGETPPLF